MLEKQKARDRDYLLCNDLSPLSLSIQTRDKRDKRLLYVDPETHDNEVLRYSRNHASPFQKDQDDTAILEPIVFEDGKLSVGVDNPNLQYFLLHHPENESNGGRTFFEHNPAEEAKIQTGIFLNEVKAMSAAAALTREKMLAVARVHLDGNVEKMSPEELEMNLILLAKENPEEFLDILDDPDLDVSNIAALAFTEQYVTFRAGKDIYYNLEDNKKKILTVPFGIEAADALADWFKTDDGKDFYIYLSKKLS
jgi:hypothetical protein